MLCILNVGTVPTLCILNVGTVPMLCILNVGTVPTLCILNVGTVPTFSHSLSQYIHHLLELLFELYSYHRTQPFIETTNPSYLASCCSNQFD